MPLAKSALSTRATESPRRAASRATPAPRMPPPMISRSNVWFASAAGLRRMLYRSYARRADLQQVTG